MYSRRVKEVNKSYEKIPNSGFSITMSRGLTENRTRDVQHIGTGNLLDSKGELFFAESFWFVILTN
jgi:hypothetical protein